MPATGALVAVTRRAIVEPLIVAGLIASLNVTVTGFDKGTLAASFAGTVETTNGAARSAVVKLATNGNPSAFAARSRAPVVTDSVYPVRPDNGEAGVIVALFVATL